MTTNRPDTATDAGNGVADAEALTLGGFRLSLVQGVRNSQVWAMHSSGASFAEIGRLLEISRGRAQQLQARCADVLQLWPEPNAWQQSLPLRLRELCAYSRVETAVQLLELVTQQRVPKHWTLEDLRDAQVALGLPASDDRTVAAIRRVGATLATIDADLELLTAAAVVGAEAVLRGSHVLRKQGEAIHRSLQTEAAAHVAALPGGNRDGD